MTGATVLVVGGGAREHALVVALRRSPRVARVATLPPAPLVDEHLAAGVTGDPNQPGDVVRAAREIGAGLVVVGPAQPLVAGVADALRASGVPVCGVGRDAALLEASKAAGQAFLERHGIPAPRTESFGDVAAALAFARTLRDGCAVKADGFADGAGVVVCNGADEAEWVIRECLGRNRFGAGPIVVQERCVGPELSVHAVTDGTTYVLLDSSQDYKRLFDGDLGPNTGGIGSYSPVSWIEPREYERVAGELAGRFVAGCRADGLDYRGIVYLPVVFTADGPRVLEINVRFGNPEVQSLMARLDSDAYDVLLGCATGRLDASRPRWSPDVAVTVASCVSGYPGRRIGEPRLTAGDPGPALLSWSSGVENDGDGLVARSGRVVTSTATGATLADARAAAYAGLRAVRHGGQYYRADVAGEPLPEFLSRGYGVLVLDGPAAVARALVAAYARAEHVADADGVEAVIERGNLAVWTGDPGALDAVAERLGVVIRFATVGPDDHRSPGEIARWLLVSAFLAGG